MAREDYGLSLQKLFELLRLIPKRPAAEKTSTELQAELSELLGTGSPSAGSSVRSICLHSAIALRFKGRRCSKGVQSEVMSIEPIAMPRTLKHHGGTENTEGS